MNKTSPRKIPRTQQDVDRAYDKGYADGTDNGGIYSITLINFILREDFAATDEHIPLRRAFLEWCDNLKMRKEWLENV